LILATIGLLLIPVWMFIGAAFPAADRFVESHPSTTWPEQIAWIGMWMAFIAAAARLLYALVIEKSSISRVNECEAVRELNMAVAGLPSADAFQSATAANWRTTNDLADPLKTVSRKATRT
jgi:hypothetical protein